MEALLIFLALILILAILDVAALKWGVNGRQPWTNGSTYDPRDDWQTN